MSRDLTFRALLDHHGVPQPVAEHRFHPVRRWRLDYAWPDQQVGLEVDGGAFVAQGGRHGRGVGFLRDLEKRNALALAGWLTLHVVPRQLATRETVMMIREALASREAA